jgi:hypothetical protein
VDKSLADHGDNGGICGANMLVLEGSARSVDVRGLAGHKINQVGIVNSEDLITAHRVKYCHV